MSNSIGNAVDMVKEFHLAFNHPSPNELTKLSFKRKLTRTKWIKEEINEFLEAKSIAEEVDAIADAIYFLCGCIVEMGITGEQFSNIFQMVQDANMQKLFPDGKPHYNSDNKVIKPDGWVAPNERIKEYINGIIKNNSNQLRLLLEEN